jgi:argininosuccinate synthase
MIAYLDETQKVVNGTVKIKLYKGLATPVGRKSANSLYERKIGNLYSCCTMSLTKQRQLDLLNCGVYLLKSMLK